jgi:hypothetical protein
MRSIINFACFAVIVLSLCAQERAPQGKTVSTNDAQGLPPRAAPADYQAQAKAGAITIAAEFEGHAISTPEGALSSDEYVVVEAAFFGEAGAKLQLSLNDFSVRINGKKTPVQRQSYELVGQSVKDPEWEPPTPQKSKTSLTGGGGNGGDSNTPPAPVRVPPEVQRVLAQRVKKASLAEGDRLLPQAGLLYFPYGGKVTSVRSIELIYAGPAGQAKLELQP